MPDNAVVIHEVRTNGKSYLQPTQGGYFVAAQRFATPDPKVFVQITSVETALSTATLRIWDLPDGCLRKEDSKPRVYLIENNAKRWITSPQALFALGKSWADVRIVPDGALDNVPPGPEVL